MKKVRTLVLAAALAATVIAPIGLGQLPTAAASPTGYFWTGAAGQSSPDAYCGKAVKDGMVVWNCVTM